jgi:hypothetical protein
MKKAIAYIHQFSSHMDIGLPHIMRRGKAFW